jgi:hypothetical protein
VDRGNGRGPARCIAACVLLATAAVGCQSDLRRTVGEIDAAYAQGRYPGAAEIAERAAERNRDDRADRLLWWLQAGRTRQAAGDLTASIAWYDRAYESVRPYLDTTAEATVSEALVTTAVNQTMRIYRATPPERIMLCALQGANRLAGGDLAGARVEFNRAADFQQDASARFAKEINAAQDRTNAEWKSGGWAAGIATDATAKVRTAQERPPAALGMSSFANPFASYLRAAFLLATSTDPGDRQNARADLRGVQEMLPGCAEAAADIAAIDGGGGPPPITWIFFLTGMAPTYREFRLDIPIPVGNVNYVSAAFPVLERRGGFEPSIGAGGARSSTIADLDAAVEAEFDARLPLIVTQEIVSSAGKAAATWAASQAAYQQNNTAGVLMQIAGIAYQAASTAADLRAWTTMPKQVALLRIPTPVDGVLDVYAVGGEGQVGRTLCTLSLAPGAPNIVLLTLPSSTAPHPAVLQYRGGTAAGSAAPPESIPTPAAPGESP